MDGLAAVQPRDRERSYPSPVYPRAVSRSSTSTSATRITPQSANSSTSRLVSSPRPSSSHPSHRFPHSSCAQSVATSRPTSVASRDRGSDSGRQSAASSYLQEKLQRRREEAERLAAVRSTQDMSASMELRSRNSSSPVKGGSVDGRRPRSSGKDETPKKMGMGLKEMEATVSTLHKQNFDLKLELFHRRERQNVLEERIDALESEKAQIDDVNDKLLDELEKRDKAVQEAVQMIVALEAQVETLFKEREMVRQIDAAGYLQLNELESRLNGPTPKPKVADLAQLEADARTLNRMPSFMSERTENTENLRKVYLNSRGSVLSLPKATEGAEDAEGRRVNSLTTPSLSVLSESSFVSVYGEREDQDQDQTMVEDEPAVDGTSTHSRPRKLSNGSEAPLQRPAMATRPSRASRSSSISRAPGPGQFQSIHDIIDHTSPLQKLARLDQSYMDKSPTQEHFTFATRGPTHKYVKDGRRDTLRRVTTDAPVTRSSDHALPPTPDTISTSTLRGYKNSSDTLHKRGVSDQRSYPFISEGTSKAEEAEHAGGAPAYQPPLVSAFGNEPIRTAAYFDTRPPLVPRPRSAGETTVSHRRGVDWESDAESVHSLDSSLDIWLQQGREPDEDSESDSPDLFSFPTSGTAWATNAVFGSNGGAFDVPGFLPTSNPAEDLISAQEALFPDAVQPPPPPPNRRSSLGARTGSFSSRNPPVNGKLRKTPSRSGSRRNSVDAQMVQLAEGVAQAPQPEPKSGRSKDNHYPPSSGAAPRGHRLNFFRRSIGSGPTVPPDVASPSPVDQAPARNGAMGVPSWVQRGNVADDDRTSATPPPIMRNPRGGRSVSVDEGAPVHEPAPMTPTTPVVSHATMTPVSRGAASGETTPTSNGASGASLNKRKWLPGFGRTSSLRNRAG